MKLMIVIVHDTDSEIVLQTLIGQGFRVTRVASTGGFLRRGNATFLIGVESEKVDKVFELLKHTTRSVEQEQHRATVFVVDMPYYEQI